MKVECPYCKEKYNIKRSQLGKRAVCNMCEQSFVLYVEGVEPPKPRKKNPKLKNRFCPQSSFLLFWAAVHTGFSHKTVWKK